MVEDNIPLTPIDETNNHVNNEIRMPAATLELGSVPGEASDEMLKQPGSIAVRGAEIDLVEHEPLPTSIAIIHEAAEVNDEPASPVAIEYERLTTMFAPGPQVEGLDPDGFSEALADPDTQLLSVPTESGESVDVPFLVPLKYASWMNSDFFKAKGYNPAKLYYCALPQDAIKQFDLTTVAVAIENLQARQPDASIVIDYFEGHDVLTRYSGQVVGVDELETSKGPAAVFHYRTQVAPREGADPNSLPEFPEVRNVSDPDEIKILFPRIWEIYSERFQELVDDHPIRGALTQEELLATLTSDKTRLKGYFNDEGQLVSFGYLVTDIDLCPWLNTERLKQETEPGKQLLYFPGIASARENSVTTSGPLMLNFLQEALKEYGEFDLTFECSNISARYIPKLVDRAFAYSGLVDYKPFEEHKYYYNVLKLG